MKVEITVRFESPFRDVSFIEEMYIYGMTLDSKSKHYMFGVDHFNDIRYDYTTNTYPFNSFTFRERIFDKATNIVLEDVKGIDIINPHDITPTNYSIKLIDDKLKGE